jgi:hypothetical protein
MKISCNYLRPPLPGELPLSPPDEPLLEPPLEPDDELLDGE